MPVAGSTRNSSPVRNSRVTSPSAKRSTTATLAKARIGLTRLSINARGTIVRALAQGFGVCRDMRLRDPDEVDGVEELADGDLVCNRPAPWLAKLACQHRPLFVSQQHRVLLWRGNRNSTGDQVLDLLRAKPRLA
jgi:hypothetical protein